MIETMINLPAKQRGSALATILVLALSAYGIFVGIQYVPLAVESGSVDAVLNSLEQNQKHNPLQSINAIQEKINNLLNINQLYDMADSFDVQQKMNGFVVTVEYERQLNLLYTTKTLKTRKSVSL